MARCPWWLTPFVIACSSSPSTPDDGGATDAPSTSDVASADAATKDVSADGAQQVDAPSDVSAPDAGPLGPNPPAGTTLCGSGTFTDANAVTTCQQAALLLSVNNACGGATMTSGRWEAWCSTANVYMWAEFDGVEVSTSACHVYSLDPDYEYGSGGGDTGNSGGDGYAGSPYDQITNVSPTNVAVWETVAYDSATKAGALYLGVSPDISCKATTPGQYLMLGAALTWK